MIIVYSPGCWDLLHVGHVSFLEKARSLGDVLIVGVPCDDVVVQDKGQPPIISLNDRVRMVQALRCVTFAAPYYSLEFLPHLKQFTPDVLAVGEDWGLASRHKSAEAWAACNQCRFIKLPYFRGESTSTIKSRIVLQSDLND